MSENDVDIEFLLKVATFHTAYKAWDVSWFGTPWMPQLEGHSNFRITITSTEGQLVEVEVRSTTTPSVFVVIKPEQMEDTPPWVQTLVKRSIELVS